VGCLADQESPDAGGGKQGKRRKGARQKDKENKRDARGEEDVREGEPLYSCKGTSTQNEGSSVRRILDAWDVRKEDRRDKKGILG
jgi:hypothetical protein